MSWTLAVAMALSGVAIAQGIDAAFINRDPRPNARIATRQTRRIAGIAAIILALINIVLQFSYRPE